MSTESATCACETGLTEEEKKQAFERIGRVIEEYRDREGSLIQVLHSAQEIYGYLPLEVQKFISTGMNIPLAQVAGVVSFYSFFSTNPRGQHTIRICMGTACYVRGGKKIVDRIHDRLGCEVGDTTKDGKFTIEIARCIGACGLAPAMTVDDTVYKQVNPNKLESILGAY